MTNVCTVLGTQNSTQLPPASVDLAFICDAYHHFEDPPASLASIHRAVRPGGRLFVIEFDKTDESRRLRQGAHPGLARRFVAEIEQAGFEAVSVEPAPGLDGKLEGELRRRLPPRRRGRRPMSDDPTPGELPRSFGMATATFVVVASMVGTGVLTTSGFTIFFVGSNAAMLVLWVVGAAIAICGALSLAELAAAMPRSGGDYVFLREAYGPLASFLSGWVSFLIGFGAPIAASAFAAGQLLPRPLRRRPGRRARSSASWRRP